MRGSPLARALLAFFIIALLGWPLWQLTRPEANVSTLPALAPAAAMKAIGLHLTFTSVPKAFTIKHLEGEIWKESAPQAEMEKSVTLDYPPEGVDLQFHVEWPGDGPVNAVRIQLTDPAGDAHEKSLWGKGTVDDVVTFP